ncbi:MAG: fibronectin type III domain-containing protein [Candidatus Competibacteraceae bacterium]|nr:fibronectin type III domain-containing protein [Candidatus Competibacteraceae bacterium]
MSLWVDSIKLSNIQWVVLLVVFLWPVSGFAKQVTLAWDANTERNVGGYRIYYGPASRAYTSTVDVGNQTTYTVPNLEEGKPYYFAVTAYNTRQTFESGFSNEVNIGGNTVLLAFQESPSQGSYESGVGLIRGWVCNASTVEVEIDGGAPLKTAYGAPRSDTAATCGTVNTGYGLTYNWGALGDGVHSLRVLADGVEFSRVSFYVTTLGQPFIAGISGEGLLTDFPQVTKPVAVRWSEPHQNFMIVDANSLNSGRASLNSFAGELAAAAARAIQESPSQGSYESGVSLIRGWVCNASTVEVEIDGGERLKAGYGTARPDTAANCGNANTGYALAFNWNSLGDGIHTLRALADGVEFANISFSVATLGSEFLTGLPPYQHTVADFPSTGRNTVLRWSEPHQNFVIVGVQ